MPRVYNKCNFELLTFQHPRKLVKCLNIKAQIFRWVLTSFCQQNKFDARRVQNGRRLGEKYVSYDGEWSIVISIFKLSQFRMVGQDSRHFRLCRSRRFLLHVLFLFFFFLQSFKYIKIILSPQVCKGWIEVIYPFLPQLVSSSLFSLFSHKIRKSPIFMVESKDTL